MFVVPHAYVPPPATVPRADALRGAACWQGGGLGYGWRMATRFTYSRWDGTQRGFHWWNRLVGGVEVDLTRGQFQRGEVVQEPRVMARPSGAPKRGEDQYRLLRERVFTALGLPEPAC